MTTNANPMSESEILRHHVFYQKSFIQANSLPTPIQSKSPVINNPIGKTKPIGKNQPKAKRSKTTQDERQKREPSPARTKTRNGMEKLEYRRTNRRDRERPWQEKTQTIKNNSGPLQLFYDATLPATCDKSKVTLRARNYVSNSKYGNIYEIRADVSKSKIIKSPRPRKWLWEDDFLLWMLESRDDYVEEIGPMRSKQQLNNYASYDSTSTNTPILPSI